LNKTEVVNKGFYLWLWRSFKYSHSKT